MMQKALCCAIVAFLALACSSCGHSPTLFPVKGKVTVKGAPATGATVFLQRPGSEALKEPTIMGIVQEDGSFSLVCGPHGQGAPPGEYDVFIEWRHSADRAKGVKGPDRLKGHYADRTHPLLHAVVDPKPTDLPPFDLTLPFELAAEPAPKRPTPHLPQIPKGGHVLIDGKEVDPETAKKMLAGPGKHKVLFKGELKGKPGDGEPALKKKVSP